MSHSEAYNELHVILTEMFTKNEDKDSHLVNFLDREPRIESYDELEENWEDNGKYSFGDFEILLTFKGEEFVLFASQSRSGSYHSDYYYQGANYDNLMTKAEYDAPKKVIDFPFKGQTIEVLTDKSAKLNGLLFATVEEAIQSLI